MAQRSAEPGQAAPTWSVDVTATAGLRSIGVACLAALALCCGVAVAAGPTLGMTAPGFRLQDQNGEWHTLDQYRGKWVALYFYPKDQTPGCTAQACDFRDNIFAFRDVGAVILGISVDTVASHKEFAEKHGLPFKILADSSKKTATDYGVLSKLFGIMEVAKRETFLIDPQGRVARHYFDVNPEGHSAIVIADLKVLMAKQKTG
jgi:thioredoxin-dependent peroxiredoxin